MTAQRCLRDDRVTEAACRERRSAHLEAALALRLALLDLDARHLGAARPPAADLDDRVDGLAGTLQLGLDRPVGAVAHPARNVVLARRAPHGVAKEDSLNRAGHDDAHPHSATTRTVRSSRSLAPRRLPPCSSAVRM